MEEILRLLWHVPTVMITLLAAGLLMGQRQVGELSVFDLLTGIAIGSVAGAGIVDIEIPHVPVLVTIMGLALFHYMMTWLKVRWLPFARLITFEPIVVVQHGKPIPNAMARVRMTIADLLPRLREQNVFDLREVQYAIFETDGKVTVVKAEQAPPKPKGLTRAVVVDGHIEREILSSYGWDERRLRNELERQGLPGPEWILVATLDEGGSLVAAPKQRQNYPLLYH